jgi:hypothetical protein
MKILYIHGFGSDPNGEKVKKIGEAFPDDEVFAPQHYSTVQSVLDTVDPIAKTMDWKDIIVGTSLGGFWTNYFTCKYGSMGVLINPATDPAKTTMKYVGTMINGVEWTESDSLAYNDVIVKDAIYQKIVLLAEDDDVIPYLAAKQKYEPIADVEVFPSGGHRFSDPNSIRVIIKSINRLI